MPYVYLTHLSSFSMLITFLNGSRAEIMDIVLGICLKTVYVPNTNHRYVFLKESYLTSYTIINTRVEYISIKPCGIALHCCSNTKHKILENNMSFVIIFVFKYFLS